MVCYMQAGIHLSLRFAENHTHTLKGLRNRTSFSKPFLVAVSFGTISKLTPKSELFNVDLRFFAHNFVKSNCFQWRHLCKLSSTMYSYLGNDCGLSCNKYMPSRGRGPVVPNIIELGTIIVICLVGWLVCVCVCARALARA